MLLVPLRSSLYEKQPGIPQGLGSLLGQFGDYRFETHSTLPWCKNHTIYYRQHTTFNKSRERHHRT